MNSPQHNAEILDQLCAQLDRIASPETRTGIELAIDTGRRPEEICDLAFDCLARDGDGLAVLVFDNHKANRLGRRLPIAETTAQVIVSQQSRVAARFPATPTGELKLLPTDRRNPDGRHSITAFSLSFAHREWVNRLPELTTADGTPFDRRRVVLYAYRHSYAQRHADAGVPIDVLAELLDHRNLNVTRGYYRVGEDRRREAVDKVTALSFDRHGNRIWRDAADSKDLRKRIAALPGFGEMKIKSLSAVLAKQFGVQAAEEIAPNHPTLGDVTSPEDLDRYQTWKRAYKKAARGA